MKFISPGQPITLQWTVYDEDDAVVDPPTGMLRIRNSDGSLVTVDLADLTRVSTGVYEYVYRIEDDFEPGVYEHKLDAYDSLGREFAADFRYFFVKRSRVSQN